MNNKLNYEVKDNALSVGLDANQDGQNSLNLKLQLSEAVQEAFAKGVAVEGVKSASIKFEGSKLVLVVDTDKDGEALLNLEVDLFEAIEETGVLK